MRLRLVCLAILLLSLPLAAQSTLNVVDHATLVPQAPSRIDPNTYGTLESTSHTISHMAFVPFTSEGTYAWAQGRYLTNLSLLHAEVQLPAGSLITFLEIEACDSSATAAFGGYLGYTTNNSGGIHIVSYDSGAVEATPGCQYFAFTPPEPLHTVDNFNNAYFIQWHNGSAFDGTVKIGAARVFYRLQISPTPTTATFDDVPVGHPLHQFIEALVASGITAGCDANNFCPNANLTRGQMAVFLAKALGLHWVQ